MDNPLVSIIVPIYNVENYLSQCLDSIIGQTYKNLDIILVNDGSTDGSLEIAQFYAASDSRITLIDKCNEGVAETRNTGLKIAKGDYILYIDSDDWMEPDMVEFLLEQSIKNNCGIVTCSMVINDGKCSALYQSEVISKEELIRRFLQHKELKGSLWNKMFRKELVQGLVFDSSVSYGEDALFCWNVFMKRAKNLLFTNRQLYHYRMNENSISHGFGKLKFTAYHAWDIITKDTASFFPTMLPLAKAHFCESMTYILYDAAKHGYRKDNHVDLLCHVLHEYKHEMRRCDACSWKVFIVATMLSWNYRFCMILFRFF